MLTRQHNLSDAEKRALKRFKGIKAPFSQDTVNGNMVSVTPVRNWREFNAPMRSGFVPMVRGRGARMSHEKRLLLLQRNDARRAFFASLGVEV